MKKEFLAAIETSKASSWTMLKALIFGQKIVTEDSDCKITMYLWRGKYYLTQCRHTMKIS